MKMCEHYRLRMFLTLICYCYLLIYIQVGICATITQGPQGVTISAGKEAIFTCIVKLNLDNVELAYDVGWFRNTAIAEGNTILNQNDRYSVERTSELKTDGKYIYSTLKIANVNRNDAGYFACFIIQEESINYYASLIVKQVPEPHCMDLPRSVTMTDRIKLSCMIRPENYVTRLTWYEGDNTQHMNTGVLGQLMDNSYLNTTVAVSDYTNGTIFKCVAAAPNEGQITETCSTNPLNIVLNEPTSLDVEVHALDPLPLAAGSQACFECIVSCDECIGVTQYTWAYDGSACQLPREISNRICFESVPLNDDGRSLRCSAAFDSKNRAGELVLQVVDTMTTAQTEIQNQHPMATTMTNIRTEAKLPNLGDHSNAQTAIQNQHPVHVTQNTPQTVEPHDGIDHLKNDDKNNPFILIAIFVIIIIIIIILGLLGFFFYHKHKLSLRENFKKADEKLYMNTIATQSGSQNNQQENSLGLDVSPMYAKVQKVNNLTEKQNMDKSVSPKNVEPVGIGMNNLVQDKSIEKSEEIPDLYAKVDKNNQGREKAKRLSEVQVTHWQSPGGDVYACVQKNRASTLPANQRRPGSKHLPSTKPKHIQSRTSTPRNNENYEITTYKNENEPKKVCEIKTDKKDGQPNEKGQPTIKSKKNSKKLVKLKASTMSPSSGHDAKSVDPQGLQYADLQFNDAPNQYIVPKKSGVIYADITKQ